MTKKRDGYGTGEWAGHSRNCMLGCSNDCAYCYARANAIKHGKVSSREAWNKESVETSELNRRHSRLDDVVMFPTRHDTTPKNIQYVLPYLQGLLEAGNRVLYVTKAHETCMSEVVGGLSRFKETLLIRVTIGSMHPLRCKFWERNAPSPQERLKALQLAYNAGFQTSVSMEPILHGVEDAVETFQTVEPYVTEKIWIGAMNSAETRVDVSNQNYRKAVNDLKKLQSKQELIRLYELLRDKPKVLWKDSIRNIVG